MKSKISTCRTTLALLSLTGLLAVTAYSRGTIDPAPIAPHAAAPQGADTSSLEGKAAPEFTLPTLDKHEAKLAEQKGKVVMVDFWATWCPPCRASLPHVQKVATDNNRLKKGLVVWVVNDKENEPVVKNFLKENKYTFHVPMDKSGDVLGKYLVRGIPTTVIIGRDGNIKKVFIGYGGEDTAKQIDEALDKALAEPVAQ